MPATEYFFLSLPQAAMEGLGEEHGRAALLSRQACPVRQLRAAVQAQNFKHRRFLRAARC